MSQTTEITLQLRKRTPPQKRLSQSKARFNIARWGRQSGKTTFGLDKLTYRPLTGRFGGIYWNVLQTYNAAEIAFDRMCRLLYKTELIRRKPHESDLCIFLQNGANVFFKSGDKPQNLRAETLDGAIIDECRQQKKEVWNQVVLPMLGRYNGWCDFYSTPNGFDWFYDLDQMAINQNPDGEWASFHAPSTECWWWTAAQILQAKASMSDSEFAQEILAEYRDLHRGSAYVNFSQDNLRKTSPFLSRDEIYTPNLPYIIGLDFNVMPMAWEIGQQRNGVFYWFDEIYLEHTHTQEAAKELVARLKRMECRGTPNVILVGDSTGTARKTSASGETDYKIIKQALKEAGITFEDRTPSVNPPVKDRINTMNAMLKAADGSIKLFFHPTGVPHLVKDMQRVTWKLGAESILDQVTDRSLTHASDAAGYPTFAMSKLWKQSAGGVFVIPR